MATQTELEQAEQDFVDMLNSAGEVLIGDVTFDRSDILRRLDPVAYNCMLDNYLVGIGLDLDEPEDEPEERDYDAELEFIQSE